MNDLTTRAGVAEILEASGLEFKRKCFNCNGTGYWDTVLPNHSDDKCLVCDGSGEILRFPTANQSEEILEKLGVQVVWSDGKWRIFQESIAEPLEDDMAFIDFRYSYYKTIGTIEGIPSQDRELANAAAVAWFCLNDPEKIKEVIG